MTARWTPTRDLRKVADPVELRTLIAAALAAIIDVLPILGELTDSRQPGLGVPTVATLKAAGSLKSREYAARYPTRRADGSLIAVGQRGLVRSDTVVTMPGERPVPVNLAAVSVADEITTVLVHTNRRIHRQIAAAGVCLVDRPTARPDDLAAVVAETRRLVDVIASPKLLLEVARTVEDLADRACTIALGADRVPHNRPCPHCGRMSLVVYLEEGVTRCEGTHRCRCHDSFCDCRRPLLGRRHEWRSKPPPHADKTIRKTWKSRKDSYHGLIRAQDEREGAPSMPNHLHFIEVENDPDTGAAKVRFVCKGDATSPCHVFPDCGCEDATETHMVNADGTHSNVPHDDTCWQVAWVDYIADAVEALDANTDEDGDIVSGPVEFEWDGDNMLWSYAVTADTERAGATS